MLSDTCKALDRSTSNITALGFTAMSEGQQSHVLLGKRFGDPAAEYRIDRSVKRFLRKAWTIRAPVTARIIQ
jgi:hypothetical protein